MQIRLLSIHLGNMYIAQILIEEGANITARNFRNFTPYDIANENGKNLKII